MPIAKNYFALPSVMYNSQSCKITLMTPYNPEKSPLESRHCVVFHGSTTLSPLLNSGGQCEWCPTGVMHHGVGEGRGGRGRGSTGPISCSQALFSPQVLSFLLPTTPKQRDFPQIPDPCNILLFLVPSTSVIPGERQKKDSDVYHAFSVSDLFLFLSAMRRVWCEVRIGQPAVMCLQNSRGRLATTPKSCAFLLPCAAEMERWGKEGTQWREQQKKSSRTKRKGIWGSVPPLGKAEDV